MKNKILFLFLNLKMYQFSFLAGKKGFSLLEVLITTGLASLIMGGTFKVLTLSTQSSQTQKLSTVEKELQTTLAKLLSDGSECRRNLNPARLQGETNQEGVGSVSSLVKYNEAGSADDTELFRVQKLFNSRIEPVRMDLLREPGDEDSDPKTGTVKRTFVLYYKKTGLGQLNTLGRGPCDASDTLPLLFYTMPVKLPVGKQRDHSRGTNL